MIKKLIQTGNSWGIVIPKAILDLLGINPVLDKVDFEIENDEIIIKNLKV